jgi:hypothetical protein
MSPIEQAKALAAYYREQAPLLDRMAREIAADKARETAAVLEQLIDELRRP